MDKNKNVVPAVLYLQEASNLLKYELPEVSTCLLQLSLLMLKQYDIDDNDILSALAIVDEISADKA